MYTTLGGMCVCVKTAGLCSMESMVFEDTTYCRFYQQHLLLINPNYRSSLVSYPC